MKYVIILTIFNIIVYTQSFNQIYDIYYSYDNYKEESFETNKFKHKDILPLIKQLEDGKSFDIQMIGSSFEEREIYLLKYGEGPRRVFLWSQMHGDEPTATMALFDIFNFLRDSSSFGELKNLFRDSLTLYFIPMLNPDGAEIFKRRSAQNIDINRDALDLKTPEARILMACFDTLRADFGFNLHDQYGDYQVGTSGKQTTIALLAPAFNEEKEINENRLNAMILISELVENLQKFIPGRIAKYDDEFEPRAFGDNGQKMGIATILVEAGGWSGDPEKQFIRKLNYILLLNAFHSIATGNYTNYTAELYDALPFNGDRMVDMVLRNVTYKQNDTDLVIDIAVSMSKDDSTLSIVKVGDLSSLEGLSEYDFSGHTCELLEENYVGRFRNKLHLVEQLNKTGFSSSEEIKVMKVNGLALKKDGIIRYVVVNNRWDEN